MNSHLIAAHNDRFRQTMSGGRVITTQGVSSLGSEGVSDVVQMVKVFDDFTEDNDPYGEHNFGSFEYHGSTYVWKISY